MTRPKVVCILLSLKDNHQINHRSVYHHFALLLEVNRNLTIDVGLYLPKAPVGLIGMPHQHSGFQKRDHIGHGTTGKRETTDVTDNDLNALLGSRICHDLISPLGAIGNGIELLSMSGLSAAPEIALISESVENANARIRYFRVAFGSASPGQVLARNEIMSILEDVGRGARLAIEWHSQPSVPRAEVKLAFLLLQCVETAFPWGGDVRVSQTGDRWHINARSQRAKIEPEIWGTLSGRAADMVFGSANVHFALVNEAANRCARKVEADIGETTVEIRF